MSNAVALVALSEVEPQPVQWLWPGMIALGKLNLLVGDPGLGKSLVTIDIAARVSTGAVLPDGSGTAPIGEVILLSAEDDLSDTIRPRLDSAGANVGNVFAVNGVIRQYSDGEPAEEFFDLQLDLGLLGDALRDRPDVKLVIIDPLSAYLGPVDSHKDSAVRRVLHKLSDFAAEHHVAVLAVSHLNKAAGMPAMYRATGSLAFVAAARAAWLVARDPEDEERRVVVPIKSNLGPDSGGLAYSIEAKNGHGTIEWHDDEVTQTADDLLALQRSNKRLTKVDEAASFLREALADGPRPALEVQEAATKAGISGRTLDRAKREVGIHARPLEFSGPSFWSLRGQVRVRQESTAASRTEIMAHPDENGAP